MGNPPVSQYPTTRSSAVRVLIVCPGRTLVNRSTYSPSWRAECGSIDRVALSACANASASCLVFGDRLSNIGQSMRSRPPDRKNRGRSPKVNEWKAASSRRPASIHFLARTSSVRSPLVDWSVSMICQPGPSQRVLRKRLPSGNPQLIGSQESRAIVIPGRYWLRPTCRHLLENQSFPDASGRRYCGVGRCRRHSAPRFRVQPAHDAVCHPRKGGLLQRND